MSWSLELRNGDLNLSGTHLGQATGAQKLVQDLRCAILEQRGTDDMHPSFGSMIDGGVDDFGNEVTSVIGLSDWDYVSLQVTNEIRRIAGEQQQRQLVRAKNDRHTYGESTLTNAELLLSLSGVKLLQVQDTLVVEVTLTTGSGREIPITVPVADGTPITT
jgi:hypothetical protein